MSTQTGSSAAAAPPTEITVGDARTLRHRVSRMGAIAGLTLVLICIGAAWWFFHRPDTHPQLTLHGNIDLRQVELAFNNSERISEVLVEEGSRVQRGQLLARLDTSRLLPQVAETDAQAAAQRAVVERLHHGNRPQEIAQARANVALSTADAANAGLQYRRMLDLSNNSAGRGVSRQDLDNAKAALDVAQARLAVSREALELEVAGPRQEDVAQAEAELRADQARLALLRQQLADSQLLAPVNGVVRSRLLEAGEMVSPQRPVFTLAVTDPKWVRAYVNETELGQVRMGMAASVLVDAFPGRRFDGWVGFVSPISEFTPKAVETEELRTSLVYEVRVFVKDPGDELPLGTPATVYIPSPASATQAPKGGSSAERGR